MTRARRAAPPAEQLAAVARLTVPVVDDVVARPAGSYRRTTPDQVLYTPATPDLARLALAGDRDVIVAVSSFGRWRHGVLVSAGPKKLRVALVTTASPHAVHDRAELPEHVWIAVTSLPSAQRPALPTPLEETVMPARTRKPTTTVAEAAVDVPVADVAGVYQDDPAPAVPDAALPPAPVAGGKKPRGAKAAVQSLLTGSEAGAANATFLPALAIHLIRPAEDNPRASLPDLEELRDSIAEHGVLEPLVVASAIGEALDGRRTTYDLVFGHRRLAAAAAAGLETVPVVVRNDLVDRRARVARVVENLQRADLTPMEEARALRDLVDDGMAQKDVAVAISRNPGHVSKRLLLLKLPASAQRLVDAGELPIDVAVELSRLPHDDVVKIMSGSTSASAIASRVQHRAAEIKSAAELAKVARELEKGGLTVIVCHSYPQTSITAGPFPLARLRDWTGYDVPARHEKLSCHAALVAPSYYLGHRSSEELADDPLSAYYQLVCTAPESHLVDREAAAAPAQPSADELARRAEREARDAAVDELLGQRWGQAARALTNAAKGSARDALARAAHSFAVSLVAELASSEVDEHVWAVTAALLAGEPEPAPWYRHEYETDLPAVDALLALLPAGAGLDRFAYAHALAFGHTELRRVLSGYGVPDAEGSPLASLHLRHLTDLAGGGIPADEVEQAIVLAGADLPAALRSWGLLAPVDDEPLVTEDGILADVVDDAVAGQPVEDVHLPEPVDGAAIGEGQQAVRDALAPAVDEDPDLRRAELGVTREAEADYTTRLGGGYAYLIPGLKTAKGQCSVCHAQVPLVAGGKAGKHRRDGDTCPGTGDPVMTLDQARPLPEQATGEPDEAVDQVVCPTCDGVGRDATDRRCRTCEGKGLVTPQLVASA